MKERWTCLTTTLCGGTTTIDGTVTMVTPVPLSLRQVTVCASADEGTVVIWNQGGTATTKSDGIQGTGAIAIGAYSAGVSSSTAYSGTTLFGAGTVGLAVAANGTINMMISSGTASKIFVTSWWSTGE